MSERAVSALLLVAVVVAATTGVGALDGDALTQVDVETDSTSLNVDLQADGDAAWEIVYRIELDDENTTQAFESLAADVEANTSTYLGPFRDRMERTVAAAENVTGRGMAVENVTVDTRRESQPQVEYGVLVYRFEWTNFGVVDGERIEAGDAIDQFFLDSETTLHVTWPDGYSLASATPETTRSSASEAVWEGQRDFDAGEPRVVLAPQTATATGGAGGTGDGAGGDTGGNGDTGDSSGLSTIILLAVGALILASGVWFFARRNETATQSGTDAGAVSETGDGGSGEAAAAAERESDGPPPELLSNEERVLQLLEDNGGRMKQKQVAEQLDWTAAKTSQVVGDLRDEDRLESFRLGRENVLTLPDVEIEPSTGDDDGA